MSKKHLLLYLTRSKVKLNQNLLLNQAKKPKLYLQQVKLKRNKEVAAENNDTYNYI
jgi:hypothetical protein